MLKYNCRESGIPHLNLHKKQKFAFAKNAGLFCDTFVFYAKYLVCGSIKHLSRVFMRGIRRYHAFFNAEKENCIMKIYGQTQQIIVREMTASDCGKFLELMTEHGTNEDFTVEDIKVVWDFRKKKSDIQCTVTNIDQTIIYGFCGIVHKERSVSLFSEYSGKGYEEQTREIVERLK